MVHLSTLFPKHGSRKAKRRIGLGVGSGMGRSATKGMKGQTSRSGNTRKESKEGGQMPLVRRIPKSGFSNVSFAKKGEFVNIGSLAKKFKKSDGFGVLLILLPIIGLSILAFGKDEYDASLGEQKNIKNQ